MKTLKDFTVWTPTKFGIGCQKIRAKSFKDAYRRLGKKERMRDGFIEDDEGTSLTFDEIFQTTKQ